MRSIKFDRLIPYRFTRRPDSDGSVGDMYRTGWNLVCYVSNSAKWEFHTYPNFQTSAKSDEATYYEFLATNQRAIFGARRESSSITKEFQGIIHSAYFKDSAYSTATIESAFLVPRTGWDIP